MDVFAIRKVFFVIFRRRRLRRFHATFRPTSKTRLLDIGGDPYTWIFEADSREPIPITLVNLQFPNPAAFNDSRFTAVYGDATDLPFEDQSFDIAYSNSVIEHMTNWECQQAFASEARRVARNLWIQTPARHFPIEPHLLTPFFQYLPKRLQLRFARRFTLWGLLSKPSAAEVVAMISEIRLLTLREMKQLFPDCLILKEKVFGLTKSYIAIREGQSVEYRRAGDTPRWLARSGKVVFSHASALHAASLSAPAGSLSACEPVAGDVSSKDRDNGREFCD